jgi:alpha-acetolactate decarboxylase
VDLWLGTTFSPMLFESVSVPVNEFAHRSTVTKHSGITGAPYAVVTRFAPELVVPIGPVSSFDDLGAQCDAHRASGNIFYAVRVDGQFTRVRMVPP